MGTFEPSASEHRGQWSGCLGCLYRSLVWVVLGGILVIYSFLFGWSLFPSPYGEMAAIFLAIFSIVWTIFLTEFTLRNGLTRLRFPRMPKAEDLSRTLGIASLAFVFIAMFLASGPAGVVIDKDPPTPTIPLFLSTVCWSAPYLLPSEYAGKYLYTVNPDGSGVRKIGGPAYRFMHVVWSPDSRHVAFDAYLETPNPYGYVSITGPTGWGRVTAPCESTNNYLEWSPDSSEIFYEASVIQKHTFGPYTSGHKPFRMDLSGTVRPSDSYGAPRPYGYIPLERKSSLAPIPALSTELRPYWRPTWAERLDPRQTPEPSIPSPDGTRHAFVYPGRGAPLGRAWVFLVYLFCGMVGPLAVSVGMQCTGDVENRKKKIVGKLCGAAAFALLAMVVILISFVLLMEAFQTAMA